jgi:hypothetical protein
MNMSFIYVIYIILNYTELFCSETDYYYYFKLRCEIDLK